MPTFEDLTGCKFGRLTVIGSAGTDKGRNRQWRCLCECGEEALTLGFRLKNGHTKSCGCLRREIRAELSTTHGEIVGGRQTRLYRIWSGMKTRCFNKNSHNYPDYGARGITVCDEWLNDFPRFKEWAMSAGYNDSLSIDREDVNGNYEPSNCRWATKAVQENNKRNNRLVTMGKETRTLAEWSAKTGISAATLRYRLNHGWGVQDSLTTPCGEVSA